MDKGKPSPATRRLHITNTNGDAKPPNGLHHDKIDSNDSIEPNPKHRTPIDADTSAAISDSLNNNTIKCLDRSTYIGDDPDGSTNHINTSDLSNTSHLSSDSANGASDSTCDNSLGSADTQPPQPFPRSILNTSYGTTGSNDSSASSAPRPPHAKKSVSFDTDDEKIKKFINGEVIVDQKNPFKSASALRREEFFNESNNKEATPATILPATVDDYISTAEVLRESKFVKTYVKNPDKYFERDPAVLEKLRKEFEAENKRRIPVRTSRLSKYSPASIYAKAQGKLNGRDQVDRGHFLSRNSSIDRSRYPDLSQIKVKVGTDLEESLYNPEEVALNARRFDDRVKNSSFGSQDDLDAIADLTSFLVDSADCERTLSVPESQEESPPKSFTNTVNSEEFQKFLIKKGLTLTPQASTGTPQSTDDQKYFSKTPPETIESKVEMENKKPKKPSVLQRLFPGRNIFFPKRKTTPKDPSPEPKTIYASTSEDEMNQTPEIKRVVLERQSFHAGQSVGQAEIAKQLRDRSRKTFMDDGSSSISSALTNAENYSDTNPPSSSDTIKRTDNKENYINESTARNNCIENEKVVRREQFNRSLSEDEKPRLKSTIRPRSSSGRSSAPLMDRSDKIDQSRLRNNSSAIPTPMKYRPSKDQPVMFQSKTPDIRDGVIKPRVQRPIPVSSASSPDHKVVLQSPMKFIKPQIPMRRTSERQSLNVKRPVTDDTLNGSLNRSTSMDKAEIKKRSITKPLIRAKPINLQYTGPQTLPHRSTNKRPESGLLETNLDNVETPKNSNDNLLKNDQTVMVTSTPISTTNQPNFYFHKKPTTNTSISPISPHPPKKPVNSNSPSKKLQLDPYSWAKLRELKDQTDRQFYKPLVVQTHHTPTPLHVNKDHIFGRTEEPPPLPENIYEKLPRHRDRNSMAARVESTTTTAPLVMIQEKAQVHLSPQEQYRQQMVQLQQQYHHQQQQQQQQFFEELNRQKEYQEKQMQIQFHKQQEQQRYLPQAQKLKEPNPNFVRNTPQRNTIGDIYRNRDGKSVDSSGSRIRFRSIDHGNDVRPNSQHPSEQEIQQPVRCQSVLGNMTNTDAYASIQHLNTQNPVVMRQKPAGRLSREEIMNRVTEFCRKSMNKTPTKHLQSSQAELNNNQKNTAEISPVSYTSLESRGASSRSSGRSSTHKPAPQVPQRVQSLSNQNYYNSAPESPIYTPVFKRGSIQSSTASELYDSPINRPVHQSNGTLGPRSQTYSETDSTYPTTVQPVFYIMDSNKVTPNHVLTYQIPKTIRCSTDPYNSHQSIESYGRIYPQENLYDSLPPPQPANPTMQRTSQIYYPINGTLRRNQIHLNAASGRSTPVVLQAISQPQPHQLQPVYGTSTKHHQPAEHRPPVHTNGVTYAPARHGSTNIVVLNNVDQMYRPIVPSQTKIHGSTTRPPSHQPLTVHRNFVKSGKHIVPYEAESASEAEEVQRILQTNQNGRGYYA